MQQSDFEELLLSTIPQGVSWSVALKLSEPTLAFQAGTDVALMRTPKLAWLVGLHSDGWTGDKDQEGEWTADSALVYREGMAQAASYFACLLLRDRVLAKGVTAIKHQMSDHYYRCLLFLEADKLLTMLDELDGKADAWFRMQLMEHGGAYLCFAGVLGRRHRT